MITIITDCICISILWGGMCPLHIANAEATSQASQIHYLRGLYNNNNNKIIIIIIMMITTFTDFLLHKY